jgi:hypothetical protein
VLQDLFVKQADCASGPVLREVDCASGPVCTAGCLCLRTCLYKRLKVLQDLFVQEADCASGSVWTHHYETK